MPQPNNPTNEHSGPGTPNQGGPETTDHGNRRHPIGQTARVHIDRQRYESPNPTTGRDLYRLGHVPHDHVLYREVHGDREDQLVPIDDTAIRLRQDEHFYSAEHHERGHAIIVNGRPKTVHQAKLSYTQVIALAFDPVPTGPNWEFTVTYRNGPRFNPQGTLVDGGVVRIRKGMIFNVTATDKS
jgi:hypothetical protein